jgi:quercetin dioxygenase-like cupin family protein
MEPAVVTAKGKDQDDQVALAVHDGQEFMYVLEGKIELTLGTRNHILKKGDAAYWYGDIPHKGISLSKHAVRTLNIHIIPGKRVGTFKTSADQN